MAPLTFEQVNERMLLTSKCKKLTDSSGGKCKAKLSFRQIVCMRPIRVQFRELLRRRSGRWQGAFPSFSPWQEHFTIPSYFGVPCHPLEQLFPSNCQLWHLAILFPLKFSAESGAFHVNKSHYRLQSVLPSDWKRYKSPQLLSSDRSSLRYHRLQGIAVRLILAHSCFWLVTLDWNRTSGQS